MAASIALIIGGAEAHRMPDGIDIVEMKEGEGRGLFVIRSTPWTDDIRIDLAHAGARTEPDPVDDRGTVGQPRLIAEMPGIDVAPADDRGGRRIGIVGLDALEQADNRRIDRRVRVPRDVVLVRPDAGEGSTSRAR